MRASLIILGKDLRQRSRDSALFVFAVALPLGLAFVFNLVLGGEQTFHARYAVADLDRGPVAQAFTEQVLRPLERAGTIRLRAVASPQEGTRLTEAGQVDAMFVIPAGFSAAVSAGRKADLRVEGSVDAVVPVQVAREIAESFAAERRSVQLSEAVGATPEQARAAPEPLTVVEATGERRELDSTTYYAAGMAVFFLFLAMAFSATGVHDERGEGTLARLLAMPVSHREILAGKSLSGLVTGVAGMAILIVATTLLLGARWGSPFWVAALAVTAVLAAAGLSALVATFARTTQQASNWQSVVAMTLGIFGGSIFPISQLGGWSSISLLTPHHWFLQGLAQLAGGGGALVPVAVLLGFGVAGGGLALLRAGKALRA
ncbi:ABC transporter permease [Nonomuraea sp. 10N515B]|uniref:ABC transporter permease n=1 Tax=Nonomuraea sp. 10N515B TaxID=3457422 RepID=UPI003FCEA5F6